MRIRTAIKLEIKPLALNKSEMTQSIAYQNHKIKVSIEGKGEPLVFLHGWPTNSNLWNTQVEVFKKNYRTIALDWLGFGKSDKPTEHHYTFTKKKEILDAVLTALLRGNEKVNIVAHDIGGPPAILWASENQERVKRLILLNTVIYPFSTFLDKMSHSLFEIPVIKEIIMSPFGLKTLIKTLSKNRGSAMRERANSIISAHENMSVEIKVKAINEPVKEGKKKEFLSLAEKYKALNVDRHLIIAESDPLCFKHIEKLSEENPDVPTYPISPCGHYIPVDQPDQLNEILLQILREKD